MRAGGRKVISNIEGLHPYWSLDFVLPLLNDTLNFSSFLPDHILLVLLPHLERRSSPLVFRTMIRIGELIKRWSGHLGEGRSLLMTFKTG